LFVFFSFLFYHLQMK